jgi:DNA-binding XRE family transcriptional regulator
MANPFKKLQDQVLSDPERRARVDEMKRAMYTAQRLGEHRESRQATQRQIADELNVTQANVSRIDHEPSLYLSTLKSYVEDLGGQLEIAAVFDNERVMLVDPRTPTEPITT